MKIRIAKLSEGENRWQESITPESVDLDPKTCKSLLEVDVFANRRPGKIYIEVKVVTEQTVMCARCCDDIEATTVGKCKVYFTERESILPEEDIGDEYRCFIQGQDELDITAEIRDAMLLAIPFQNFCSDDCKGLCTKCGVNLNRKECECSKEAAEDTTKSSIELN